MKKYNILQSTGKYVSLSIFWSNLSFLLGFSWLLFTAPEDYYFVVHLSDSTCLQSGTYCFVIWAFDHREAAAAAPRW